MKKYEITEDELHVMMSVLEYLFLSTDNHPVALRAPLPKTHKEVILFAQQMQKKDDVVTRYREIMSRLYQPNT